MNQESIGNSQIIADSDYVILLTNPAHVSKGNGSMSSVQNIEMLCRFCYLSLFRSLTKIFRVIKFRTNRVISQKENVEISP